MRQVESVETENGWSRRDWIGGAALFAMAAGLPFAAVRMSDLDAEDVPSDRQRMLIRDVAQLTIPRTGTPGAGEVGVGDFVVLALAHGLEGSREPGASAAIQGAHARFRRRDGTLRHLDWLEDELDRRGRSDFLAQARETRSAVLERLDAEAFAEGAEAHPWRTLKALILTGYYTSEIGGSRELRYELVPGRWDPDIPLNSGDRAWSSDWTAVDFG